MGLFGSPKKKKRSLQARINKELKLIAKKEQQAKLAALQKKRRGY